MSKIYVQNFLKLLNYISSVSTTIFIRGKIYEKDNKRFRCSKQKSAFET